MCLWYIEYNLWLKKKKWKYHAREKKKTNSPSLSLPLLYFSVPVSPYLPPSPWFNLSELCKSPPSSKSQITLGVTFMHCYCTQLVEFLLWFNRLGAGLEIHLRLWHLPDPSSNDGSSSYDFCELGTVNQPHTE